MALYKTISVSDTTKVLIWKIEEDEDTLLENITLSERCKSRLSNMKSELHRRGFLSVRHLLKEAGYTAEELYYDEAGKPHLRDGKKISITHSFIFSGIIISDSIEVGIDIEKRRDKITKIAHKFTPIHEYRTLANTEAIIRKLTIVWCAKEALYKIYATPGLLFLEHIYVDEFSLEEKGEMSSTISYRGDVSDFDVRYMELEDEEFTCAFALKE